MAKISTHSGGVAMDTMIVLQSRTIHSTDYLLRGGIIFKTISVFLYLSVYLFISKIMKILQMCCICLKIRRWFL